MTVGLDTSVMLRLLTGEPQPQALRALGEFEKLLKSGVSVLVSDLVIAEVYFALHHHYAVPRTQALSILSRFLSDSGVVPAGAAASVLKTLGLATANPGFVDRLIYADYLRSGQEVLTFEKAGCRLPHVRVLTAE